MNSFELILSSNHLKKRFCKDTGLPVIVFENPYFLNRLNLFHDTGLYGDVKRQFDVFVDTMSNYQTEQQYMENYNAIKENVIAAIKNNKYYQDFISMDMPKADKKYAKQNVYQFANDGKKFISVDMSKANFHAMQYYSDSIFEHARTWEEFMSKFTDDLHIINSKYIRQVIMGTCNPKKQIQYETWLMCELLKKIEDTIPVSVYGMASDEILLEDTGNAGDIIKLVRNKGFSDFPVRVSYFTLRKAIGMDGYVKIDTETGKHTFKCFDSDLLPQVLRYYNNEEIRSDDMIFMHNGQLAMFMKKIKNPIPFL